MESRIAISGKDLTLADFRAALAGPCHVVIESDARRRIEASHGAVQKMLESGDAIYGVNTGFGRLATTRVAPQDVGTLQVNLVRSHAAGTGVPLDPDVVRLIMVLKLRSLARGHSGVRQTLVMALASLVNNDVLPVIPSQGSVGASGDLAPLAHLSLVLIGEGEASHKGRRMSGKAALKKAGLQPIVLGPKEGLALLNGTQVSTAIAIRALLEAETTMQAAILAGAMAVDAVKGSDTPFDPRIHAIRPHAGQTVLAGHYRRLLEGSAIRASHLTGDTKVQDPYSFRCQPQVLGAALDLLSSVRQTLTVEANSVTDNPLVFAEDGVILSGGNFHAEPVAFAADIMALAIAEMGSISERRIALLTDTTISDLPPFLAKDPGLNSGYMIAHVTAAALASENKMLSHPASVDSLPTSANQEDHVSMATHGALRLLRMNANTRNIIAIELMAAADGIEFRRPLKSSPQIEEAHRLVRARVRRRTSDREFGGDIATASELIGEAPFAAIVGPLLEPQSRATASRSS